MPRERWEANARLPPRPAVGRQGDALRRSQRPAPHGRLEGVLVHELRPPLGVGGPSSRRRAVAAKALAQQPEEGLSLPAVQAHVPVLVGDVEDLLQSAGASCSTVANISSLAIFPSESVSSARNISATPSSSASSSSSSGNSANSSAARRRALAGKRPMNSPTSRHTTERFRILVGICSVEHLTG